MRVAAIGLGAVAWGCTSGVGLAHRNEAPEVSIALAAVEPAGGGLASVTLVGQVGDDGDAPDAISLWWRSDLDGVLGGGGADAWGRVEATFGSVGCGLHRISLQAVDGGGAVGSAKVQVRVDPPPPTVEVRRPDPGAPLVEGDEALLELGVDVDAGGAGLTVAVSARGAGVLWRGEPDASGTALAALPALTAGPHQIEVVVTAECRGAVARSSATVPVWVEADGDGDGVVPLAGDCDDGDPEVHPGGVEVCDGADQDCDGEVDEDFDADGDGVASCTGDCDDADPGVHPGAVEVCDDGIDQDCDGAAGACRLLDSTGPHSLTAPYWTGVRLVGAAGDGAGAALAVGDFDGDGLDDLAVGAPESGGGSGRIYVALGADLAGGAGDLALEAVGSEIAGTGADAGRALAAGDLDGDGLDDLAVGLPERDRGDADGSGVAAGAVALLLGPITASLWVPDALWIGARGGDRAGAAVALTEDATGDGIGDLAIGAPGGWDGAGSPGAVYIVAGAADLTAGIAEIGLDSVGIRFVGGADGDGLGAALAFLDLDGDGGVDLALGADGTDVDGILDAGAVYFAPGPLGDGRDQGVASLPALVGVEAGAARALVVAAAGDVDGDGAGDVVVGLPHATAPGSPEDLDDGGLAALVYGPLAGSPPLTAAHARTWGTATAAHMGAGVSSAGDFDGDGWDDLVLAAPWDSTTGDRTGRVLLIYGGPVRRGGSLGPDDADVGWEGPAGGGAGAPVAAGTALAAGDFDGDGRSDVAIGAPGDAGGAGAVYLLWGRGI